MFEVCYIRTIFTCMKEQNKIVAYLRVSTSKQGSSGLGIDAQREAIHLHCKQTNSILLSEYVEVESGKTDNRPQLEQALKECKREDATLVVSKLDRLSRSVSFIFKLRDNKVKFQALDLPEFNTLTLAIFAAFAQHERERISERIKDALQEAKRKGVQLGTPENLTYADRVKGGKRRKELSKTPEALKARMRALSLFREFPAWSYEEVAEYMDKEGWTAPRGGKVYPNTVYRWVNFSGKQ